MCELKLIEITEHPITSTFEIYAKGERVGRCMLHHEARSESHLPEGFSGHIFYEIFEPFQGKGYAKAALEKLVVAARHIGLPRVFVVVSDENVPSQKVIEGRGAQLIGATMGSDGRYYRRYAIDCNK
ncbi:MAG TPA: GNAT family N-acetyltransferase [Candidatus Paceibacterota bacterium]|nr:GNAT family N-acetyltransferase [Candidatus Paceibacterota bacterium]